jgi:hypothetical protein
MSEMNVSLTQAQNRFTPEKILNLAPWHIGLDLRLTIIAHANFLGSQMTIAQIVYDNERSFGYNEEDIHSKVRLT